MNLLGSISLGTRHLVSVFWLMRCLFVIVSAHIFLALSVEAGHKLDLSEGSDKPSNSLPRVGNLNQTSTWISKLFILQG